MWKCCSQIYLLIEWCCDKLEVKVLVLHRSAVKIGGFCGRTGTIPQICLFLANNPIQDAHVICSISRRLDCMSQTLPTKQHSAGAWILVLPFVSTLRGHCCFSCGFFVLPREKWPHVIMLHANEFAHQHCPAKKFQQGFFLSGTFSLYCSENMGLYWQSFRVYQTTILAVEGASPRSALHSRGLMLPCSAVFTRPSLTHRSLFFHPIASSALRRNEARNRTCWASHIVEVSTLTRLVLIMCEHKVRNADGGQLGIFSVEQSVMLQMFWLFLFLHSSQPRKPTTLTLVSQWWRTKGRS